MHPLRLWAKPPTRTAKSTAHVHAKPCITQQTPASKQAPQHTAPSQTHYTPPLPSTKPRQSHCKLTRTHRTGKRSARQSQAHCQRQPKQRNGQPNLAISHGTHTTSISATPKYGTKTQKCQQSDVTNAHRTQRAGLLSSLLSQHN